MGIQLNNNSTNQTKSNELQMKKAKSKNPLFILVVCLLISVAVISAFVVSTKSDIKELQRRNEIMSQNINENQDFNNVVLNKLDEISNSLNDIKERQNQIEKAQTELQDKLQEVTKDNNQKADLVDVAYKEHNTTITYLKDNGFTIDTDLGQYTNLTEKDMNDIIDWFDTKVDGGTPFKGNGYVFVKASQKTGLSPLYIFAHASLESGYGKSKLAQDKSNYFGIGAWDSDPYNLAHTMGNTLESGIVNGANWIANRYYKAGYTTLRKMKERGYATDPNWENQIVSIANRAIVQLKLQKEGAII